MKNHKLTLRPDQLKHVRKISHFKGRALIANQMRTGKTIITLQWLYKNPKAFPALIACPEIGKLHWEEKAARHYNIRGTVLNGENPWTIKKAFHPDKLYIINWDILQYWEAYLLAIGLKTFVMDECFPYETKICTDKGDIPIGEIVENKLDVKIKSFNFSNKKVELKPISRYIKKRKPVKLIRIKHQYGWLECTPEHKIWENKSNAYKKAKNLQAGDILYIDKKNMQMVSQDISFQIKGKSKKQKTKIHRPKKNRSFECSWVESVTILEQRSNGHNKSVYDLEVDDNHNYFANNVLVSNCHYIKNPLACWSKTAIEIGRKSKYVLGLSGTPAKSRPVELFTALNLIRPNVFKSRTNYQWRYCDPKMGMKGKWDFKGAKHLDELHLLLKKYCLIRCTRKEVFGEQPKDRRIVTIKLSGKKRREYVHAENDFIKWLTKLSPVRAQRAKKVKRLVQIGYLKRLAAELKMQGVLKWIDNYREKHKRQKIAIFAIHKTIIKQLKSHCKNCVVVDGSVRGRKRKIAIDTFQTRKNYKIFIGQTRAAGTVIELSAADVAIGIEFDWTPGDVNQWEDRIFKQDSTKALKIFHLVAENTIEEKLCKILQSKQETLSMIFDGVADSEPLNVYDLLEQELLKGK